MIPVHNYKKLKKLIISYIGKLDDEFFSIDLNTAFFFGMVDFVLNTDSEFKKTFSTKQLKRINFYVYKIRNNNS